MGMIILVADKFETSGLEGLKGLGCDVRYEPDLKEDALRVAVAESGAEVLVVRSTKVPAEVIAGSKLKVIIRAGAGYNTIDVAAATENGVAVANCPGKNSVAVAELAFGLMLALDRQIPDNVVSLRNGQWNKKAFGKARGIFDSTLGLVGMGQIGQEMIPRAKAFGMNVLAFSSHMTTEQAKDWGVSAATSLTDLASRSDIVSVHTSLRPETKGMLGKEFFDAMKPGALFINTSRAEVVDQAALLAAVESGKIRAGLDVFDGEPAVAEGEYDGPLRSAKGVYATHHIGASTDQAQEAVAAETVRIVSVYKSTGDVPNVVNR